MPDDKPDPATPDPLTSMSMEIDALKVQLADAKKQVDAANQNVAVVINANKALMAELNKGCTGGDCTIGGPVKPNKPNADQVATSVFYDSLGIKKGE